MLASTIKIAVCAAIITLAVSVAFSCSMAQLPDRPRSIVNNGMYILVGEVIGYTAPISDPNNFRGSAVGLRLKIVESIHFPYFQNDYVELFMFGHGTDCFPEAGSDRPPLGTRYRLALGEARLVASRSGSHVRLESKAFSRIAVDEPIFGYSTDAKSEFDYKRDYRRLADKFLAADRADRRAWLDDFLYIEASKDLLRLKRAASESERIRILERLLYCPNINYRRLFLSEVGKPLRYEEGDISSLLSSTSGDLKPPIPKQFSQKEKDLLAERLRLESSGELDTWKR